MPTEIILFELYDELTDTYEFLVWLHNIIVFAGGGLGLLAWLLILRQPVVGRNGNLWAFCYTSILYYATLIGIDSSYYEAAVLDGASVWQQIRHIPILVLRPVSLQVY